MARPAFIDLNLDGNNKRLRRYTFMISLYCGGSCDTSDDLSIIIHAPNKMEDVNLNVLNMLRERNESKPLSKHISFN